MLKGRLNQSAIGQNTAILERQRADAAFSRNQYYAAMPVYQKLAEAGDSTAMGAIGTMYSLGGEGLPKDVRQAAQWHLKAAKAGNSASMQSVGLDYMDGDGVQQDYEEAFNWLKQAADAGQPVAMAALGSLYGYGKGVPKDMKQAEFWLRKATTRGDENTRNGAMLTLRKLGLHQ
jgi:TPR repeat protein